MEAGGHLQTLGRDKSLHSLQRSSILKLRDFLELPAVGFLHLFFGGSPDSGKPIGQTTKGGLHQHYFGSIWPMNAPTPHRSPAFSMYHLYFLNRPWSCSSICFWS